MMKIINKWSAELMDVKTAFRNGFLDEQIFMRFPEGAKEANLYDSISGDDCLELHKCIYGTVQSPRQWYNAS